MKIAVKIYWFLMVSVYIISAILFAMESGASGFDPGAIVFSLFCLIAALAPLFYFAYRGIWGWKTDMA